MKPKTFSTTDASETGENVPDVQKFGNIDMSKLLRKASSEAEGWMKSIKAIESPVLAVLCRKQLSREIQTGVMLCSRGPDVYAECED